jgi:carbon-monoxide dehydrogenase large subunit
MSILGHPVLRREDPRFLTAGGTYVEDLALPGCAAVAYVRSPLAHGRITRVDADAARSAPGVLAVVTGSELADFPPYPPIVPAYPAAMARPFLAADVVRFVGEPVAVVVAETRAQAFDAVDLVEVDYDPLPALVDPEASLTDDLVLFPEAGTNTVLRAGTKERADFSACEVVVSQRMVNQRIAGSPIEGRAGAALWTEDGRLTHYSSCQGAHPAQGVLATVYELPTAQIRVVVPDVGGGFGSKARPYPEEILLGELARRVGRPVRWVETRTENMLALGHGRGQIHRITIGGSRDGRISAYQLDVIQDSGAYPLIAAFLINMTMRMTTGVYAFDRVGFNGVSVATTTTPMTAFRGAGRPEAAAAVERAVDLFAAEVGLDPAEVRRRNLVAPFNQPYTTAIGTTYDVGDYGAALDRALAAANYDELRANQARRRASGDDRLLGIGLSVYVEITAGAGGFEYGSVELLEDGSARVVTGSTPYGQGHVTAWSMIVADRTGIPIDRIEVVHGDTDVVPSGSITGGSRSAQVAGAAVANASTKLIDQARQRAADLLEANPDDVVLSRESGQFHVAGTPAKAVSWADVAAATVREGNEPLQGVNDWTAAQPTFPFGAHVAVVEVDRHTGQVTLLRHVACDDAGTILNPLLVDGQVHGGLGAGIAQALYEEVRFDEDGNPLTTNFADYAVISAAELPMFERVPLETPTFVNELGAKGIGESGTIGSTPAVQNAVVDAVAHLGVRHIDLPCTPERVWRAIQAAGG